MGAYNGTVTITRPESRTMWIAPSANSNFYWDFLGIPASFVNQLYTRQPPIIVATKNPAPGAGVTYTGVGFPSGISYNTTSGEISGTPVEVGGIYPVTLTATSTGGDVSGALDRLHRAARERRRCRIRSRRISGSQAVDQRPARERIPGKRNTSTTPTRGTATALIRISTRRGLHGRKARLARALTAGEKNLVIGWRRLQLQGGTTPTQSVTSTRVAISKSPPAATRSPTVFHRLLRHTVMLGNKGYKLDEFFDLGASSRRPWPIGKRRSWKIRDGQITAGEAGKDAASFAMLLADPAFDFTPGSTVFQFRLLNAGVPFFDRTFTALVTGTEAVDNKTGCGVQAEEPEETPPPRTLDFEIQLRQQIGKVGTPA